MYETRSSTAWRLLIGAVLLASSLCVASLTPDEVQQWVAENDQFDWQQGDGGQVRVLGRGAQDSAGNLYFAGAKSYPNSSESQNMFVACINADDSLGWTKEVRSWCVWRDGRL